MKHGAASNQRIRHESPKRGITPKRLGMSRSKKSLKRPWRVASGSL